MTGRPRAAQDRLAAFKPKPPTEDAGHLSMAAYLHAAFPGGNPRPVVKAKGVAVKWEPPHPWLQWWHTPNQGARDARTGAKYRDMGMRAGVSDFSLLVRLERKVWIPAAGKGEGRGGHVIVPMAQAAFIEAKRDGDTTKTRGSLSKGQENFRDAVVPLGAWWAEVRNVVELDAQLHQWLDPLGLTWRTPPMASLHPAVNRGSV